jgi:ribosomal protein S18 acetylase RimI-like enzyme
MYKKQIYLTSKAARHLVVFRPYYPTDFEQLIEIQQESFPPPFPSELWWNKEQLHNHVTLFPEGAICAEINGELVGSITGLLVIYNPAHPEHTWDEITASGYISNHNPNGDSLYIVDICVKPQYRGLDIGRWLMFSLYDVVIHKGLKRVLGGGRMPGYHQYADKLKPEAYLQKVMSGEIKDLVISFLLSCGRIPVHILPEYLEDDESLNHAVLMEWKNPFIQT